ncbi:acyl carrier protein [uncultured Clostridium sp.]|jgi:acyl carrier protein|uniref:acyl carrier protein n=1 Tax=uncultured Clostridium sp. TaxID=59620 RepID=UPI00261E555C|nr:acyl carrier protein [uncultured Clostridium sp.]
MFEKIRTIICEKLEIEEEKVTLETTFEDLGADSLDLFEVIMDIEDEFDVKLEDPTKIKTVKDAIDYVESASK